MNRAPNIAVDTHTGTLTARIPGRTAVMCALAPNDDSVVLGKDVRGHVVGVTVLSAMQADASAWFGHPDRGALPRVLLSALDRWFKARRGK